VTTIQRDQIRAIVRPPAGEGKRPPPGGWSGALVLHHGRGTDEHDLAPLLDVFDPQRRLLGLSVGAPLTLPGTPGHHWYALAQLGYPPPEHFIPTWEQLTEFLDTALEEHDVPIGKTIVGGFSQGTVMSYALGLARDRPAPAGILAMSGFIPHVEGVPLDPAARKGMPVAIAHGSLDPVIPVDFAHAARDELTAAGLDVEYHESPMGHTIDPRVIPALSDWVARVLP
jgi:phospholipase/carboxylesterase